jgi:NAD(P)-dependent dehydrogenase (short-subunit alcohol dehydrogenase family)
MMPNENGSFAGKVAFVTGAANGIGRAAALAFAREGVNVTAADLSEQGNQETARMIEEAGGRALAVKCDVSRDNDVKAGLEKTVETFGRLDFAFNNAGVEQPITPAADLSEEEWDRIVDINLRGVFLCMKHEIPLMLKQGGGAIVNTSSGAGVKGIAGQAAYCAAKFGIVGLTKAAARSPWRDNPLCSATTARLPHRREPAAGTPTPIGNCHQRSHRDFGQRELVRFGRKVIRSGNTANRTMPATMIHTKGHEAR